MKIKIKRKSLSIYTRKKQVIVRYWGGLKFDIITLYNPAYNNDGYRK